MTKNIAGALAQPAVGVMAFARFAKDSPNSPGIRSVLFGRDPDRSFFKSLANRVNAIDPYDIHCHSRIQRAIYFT